MQRRKKKLEHVTTTDRVLRTFGWRLSPFTSSLFSHYLHHLHHFDPLFLLLCPTSPLSWELLSQSPRRRHCWQSAAASVGARAILSIPSVLLIASGVVVGGGGGSGHTTSCSLAPKICSNRERTAIIHARWSRPPLYVCGEIQVRTKLIGYGGGGGTAASEQPSAGRSAAWSVRFASRPPLTLSILDGWLAGWLRVILVTSFSFFWAALYIRSVAS